MQEKTISQFKDWANPTPAGLVALAVACMCFFALLSGNVETTAMPLVGCWLLGGFIVQIVVALLDLKGGNHSGGNTFLYFSAFFMLTGGIEMFVKYNAIVSGMSLDARIDGYAWCVLALTLLLWTPAFLKKFSLLSIIVLLLDLSLPFIALIDLGVIPKNLSIVPACTLFATAIIAIYFCSAIIVNTTFGKKVYPIL